MIVEITPELVLGVLANGNEIHVKVEQGIGPDYTLEWARLGDNGNLVLGLKHKNDDYVSSAPYALMVTSLECGYREDSSSGDSLK